MKKYYYVDSCKDMINPTSPININNYTNLCEPYSEYIDKLDINVKKGWMYVLVPNTVKSIKLKSVELQAYTSNSNFTIIDENIPGHIVYKLDNRPCYSGKLQLEFIYN